MHNNIDSQSFNAKAYFKSFIKDKSVEEVLKKKSELQQGINSHLLKSLEIRTLDSDLQTLVYENYNKFISATDVIKNVSASFSI